MHREIQDKGLSSEKAERLLEQYGPNEIKLEKRFTLLKSGLAQFKSFLPLLLLFAGITSYFLGEIVDSFFIFLIVAVNAIFGVIQEFKAEKSLDALKSLTVSKIRVIRDGREEEIDSRYLVPDDIIYIEEGTKIPADCRLIKSWQLEVNEAALTGESLPIPKTGDVPEENKLFMGTVVSRGNGYARIEKTGMTTRFGQIAESLKNIETETTPLQKKLNNFTKQIGLLGVLTSGLVFALTFLEHGNLFTSFLFATSLAVAAVPEGLPAVMTITLAIGIEAMAKKKAIVRRLASIEALGAMTLVATDKTGTLTTGQMAVKKIWTLEGENGGSQLILLNSILCSTANLVKKAESDQFDIIGDSTEGALLLFAAGRGENIEAIRAEWTREDELLFNAVTKRMVIKVKKGRQELIFAKGAPESILNISKSIQEGDKVAPLDARKKSAITEALAKEAKKGYRLIAFSYHEDGKAQDLEKNHIFLGFAALADPVRPEVNTAVQKAYSAGIKVVMITGDNELTAEAIGMETGIIKAGADILTGVQIDEMDDEKLISILDRVKIYARTTPQHKLRLVGLYQRLGEVVVVTGDGVNDALALKKADVGIAMGQIGTDVTKETADIVLTDDNFATLINAIEEGRHIFNNIKSSIKYLLTGNSAEVLSVLLAVILRFPPILMAIQILYINLVSDGLPALSLAFSPKHADVMSHHPRYSMNILDRSDFKHILLVGGSGALITILSYLVGTTLDGPIYATTMAFTTLSLLQPFILVDFWLSGRSIFKNLNLLKKPIFLAAFGLPFLVQPFLLYNPTLAMIFKLTPLSPAHFMLSLCLSLTIFVPIGVLRRRTITFLFQH